MGRVARYKKIKACDPFSKQNRGRFDLDSVGVWGLGDNGRKAKKRSKVAERMQQRKLKRKLEKQQDKKKNKKMNKEKTDLLIENDNDGGGFDLPPTGKDEFDLNDLEGSIKKEPEQFLLEDDITHSAGTLASLTTKKSFASALQAQQDEREEAKMLRLLKIDMNNDKKKQQQQDLVVERKQGETKRAFQKRFQAETREFIHRKKQLEQRNPQKREKKKEFLNNKKNKTKKNNNNNNGIVDLDHHDTDAAAKQSPAVLAEQALEARAIQSQLAARLGEQADRPPIFQQIPRGAKAKTPSTTTITTTATTTNNNNSKKRSSDERQAAERRAMEELRLKVQAQYNVIKAKRRRMGVSEFHL